MTSVQEMLAEVRALRAEVEMVREAEAREAAAQRLLSTLAADVREEEEREDGRATAREAERLIRRLQDEEEEEAAGDWLAYLEEEEGKAAAFDASHAEALSRASEEQEVHDALACRAEAIPPPFVFKRSGVAPLREEAEDLLRALAGGDAGPAEKAEDRLRAAAGRHMAPLRPGAVELAQDIWAATR